ncbi:hypothetical protein [Demequina aurantiaca]|uniref:hypothetical protein n=1 Tax=Demequina aurantiaca TaxID=676200 RepID=UPI003D334D18
MSIPRTRAAAANLGSVPPRLRDGLAVFALDGNRVRIGLADPVVLEGLSSEEAAFVARLEEASACTSADVARYEHVIRRLDLHGLLAHRGTSSPPGTASSGEGTGTGTGTWHATVCVVGADDLAMAIGLCLAQAGVRRIEFEDAKPAAAATPVTMVAGVTRAHRAARAINGWVPHAAHVAGAGSSCRSPDVTVIVASGSPDLALVSDLMAADQPHLPVITDERGVTVGPFVIPGAGPCLTCLGISRTEADADWPLVALQCNGSRPTHASAAVRALTAGVACDSVVRFLDGGGSDARQWRAESRTNGDGPRLTERVVRTHPSCRCSNPLVRGDDLEDQQAILF